MAADQPAVSILGDQTTPGRIEKDEAVSRRFRGEYTFKVDTKGRTSIPASFRRVIQSGDPDFTEGLRPQFVIVYGGADQPNLECYTIHEMEKLEERIERLPNSDLKRQLVRRYISLSIPGEVDPDGRLVLPQEQRNKIGLEKEAKFVGTLTTFQIWHPQAYESTFTEDSTSEQDLGFGIPAGTDLLDALDMALSQQDVD